MLSVFMCFLLKFVLVAEYHVDCWQNTAVTSAVTNFQCHKLIAKVNKWKNSDMENFICNQYREKLAILNTENIKICGSITKPEATKMQLVCTFFHVCWIFAENLIFSFPRWCSNMHKVRCVVSYGFYSKFRTLFSSAKILNIG